VDLVLDMSRAILIDPDSGQVLPGGNGSGRTETMAGGH
jgi:hypothetical protein